MAGEPRYYAHSAQERSGWEPLKEHLRLVAERAARYASVFGAEEEARLAGLLHDLGKYSPRFLQRLENKAHYLDHWTPGASVALREYRQHGIAAALAIQGHHIGLRCAAGASIKALLPGLVTPAEGLTFTESDPEVLLRRLAADGLELPPLDGSLYTQRAPQVGAMLDIRMLFSALVDADFLETEAHFDRDSQGDRQYRAETLALDPERALEALDAHLETLAEANRDRSAEAVQRVRAKLLEACREGATEPRGLFTLTAPTGAGKTLSMLAFALRHARRHGLRRIVMAIPFLSILEQNAKVYRELLEPVFGPRYVLEHHSLAGTRGDKPEDDEQDPDEILRRRQAENWDAPLVVTTNVQLLESLFAHRPGACRKLHRLADSVILFDEVQTLPLPLVVHTLAALSRLSERYGASVVFSTATQPAFDHLHDHVRKWCAPGWQPEELVPKELDLFGRSRRVEPDWRLDGSMSWDEVTDELAAENQVLCIVNLKRHARKLAEDLQDRGVDGVLHLSTSMCPAHRSARLEEVKRRLENHEPCRLISTQCVEAGVDVDFPVVYRAFGPLDAIAQAAGRCNRNGKLPSPGRLVVFVPEDEKYPGGGYRRAAAVTRQVVDAWEGGSPDLQDPKLFRTWYRRLYDISRVGDEQSGREEGISTAHRELHFENVAGHYRLIPDDTAQVVVPWDRERFEDLEKASKASRWIKADWLRAAQVHSVGLYRTELRMYRSVLLPAPLGAQLPEDRSEDWFFLTDEEIYDEDFGLGEPRASIV